jgi:tetraacyldisaccharide 4'-kinase
VLVATDTEEQARTFAASLGVAHGFRLVRAAGTPLRLDAVRASAPVQATVPVIAAAGIARPDRFFDELRAAGWDVRDAVGFPDHHRYSRQDGARLADRARRTGAKAIVTTEKDLVRLLPFRPLPSPVAWVPLDVRIEPAPAFRAWLAARLDAERGRGGRA